MVQYLQRHRSHPVPGAFQAPAPGRAPAPRGPRREAHPPLSILGPPGTHALLSRCRASRPCHHRQSLPFARRPPLQTDTQPLAHRLPHTLWGCVHFFHEQSNPTLPRLTVQGYTEPTTDPPGTQTYRLRNIVLMSQTSESRGKAVLEEGSQGRLADVESRLRGRGAALTSLPGLEEAPHH